MKHLKRFNESIFDEPSYKEVPPPNYEDDDDDYEDEANKYDDLNFSEKELFKIKSLCDKLNLNIFPRSKRLGLIKKMGPNKYEVSNMVIWKADQYDGVEWYRLADFDHKIYEVDGFDSLLQLIQKFNNEFVERVNKYRAQKGAEPIK